MSAPLSTIVHKIVALAQKRRSRPVPEASETSPVSRPAGSRGAVYSVPLVLVSTLALSLNLAAPAQAAVHVKKPLKSIPTAAIPTPVASTMSAVMPTRAAPVEYTVADGDTISGISERFGVASATVLARNGLGWSSVIFPGQVLNITDPVAPVAATGPAVPAAGAAVVGTHNVVNGDTIGAIAATAGVSVQQVLSANGLGWSSIIYPGQVLSLPGSISSVAAVAAVPITPIAAQPAVYVTAGIATELSAEMRQNAQTIVSVGRAAGVPDEGLVVALAAAAQESGLRNVGHGDRDSLGLFQQRPSRGWGSLDQVQDPVRASRAFFGGAGNPNPGVTRGLLDIVGWHTMSVTQAAQAVQISAYPEHYAKWETSARLWLTQVG